MGHSYIIDGDLFEKEERRRRRLRLAWQIPVLMFLLFLLGAFGLAGMYSALSLYRLTFQALFGS